MLNNTHALLSKISNARVLATGDLILDRYVYGDAARLSPEAPVPVVLVKKKTYNPGGMGNVVMNLFALGAKPLTCGLVGADSRADKLKELLEGVIAEDSPGLVVDKGRPTTVKTRVIAGIQQVVRFDEESTNYIPEDICEEFKKTIQGAFSKVNASSISDYGKGSLTRDLLSFLLKEAKKRQILSIVDPKGTDYSRYEGAYLVTPNRQELAIALGKDISKGSAETLANGGLELINRYGFENVLITRSEDGMTLVKAKGTVTHFPTVARAVFDVSGAGDTVVAALTAALAVGAEIEEGAMLATLAAGVVVGKVGTATASPEEILESLEITKLKSKSEKK
jgi:D-beta-D-heptose 7-phosphate kinase/D-beta-D-heptose 1-phosphate adenosyltransferase